MKETLLRLLWLIKLAHKGCEEFVFCSWNLAVCLLGKNHHQHCTTGGKANKKKNNVLCSSKCTKHCTEVANVGGDDDDDSIRASFLLLLLSMLVCFSLFQFLPSISI